MAHAQIEITTDDGTCPAHVYTPDGSGPWPGVLLFMDGIGMRPAIRSVAERIASAGFYVLMPDLFYRMGAYSAPEPAKLFGDPVVMKEWFTRVTTSGSSADNMMRDTKAYLAHLDAQPDVKRGGLGATGYCMGGRLALSAAGHFPDRIVAIGAYHPGGLATDAPDSPHLLADKIRAEVYVAAAMDDQSFPAAQIERLDQALTAANVTHTIETYPARHGWVPSDTPVHDAAQAERHYETLTALLRRRLPA
jgi:carboxymethylenebutenolidase